MSIEWAHNTKSDKILCRWIDKHHFNADDRIIVSYAKDKEDAKVSRGDMVNTQMELLDGRLLKAMHVSAQSKGDQHTIHVIVEPPPLRKTNTPSL